MIAEYRSERIQQYKLVFPGLGSKKEKKEKQHGASGSVDQTQLLTDILDDTLARSATGR
jgi:hypothetical protein